MFYLMMERFSFVFPIIAISWLGCVIVEVEKGHYLLVCSSVVFFQHAY